MALRLGSTEVSSLRLGTVTPSKVMLGDVQVWPAAGGTTIGMVTVTGIIVPPATDPDAAAYITAVEAADGRALEAEVRTAIDAFVIGCKADGTWSALSDCCLLMGARTLAGALINLVSRAPTPSANFVAGDYDRKRLLGDGINKFLTASNFSLASSSLSAHWSVLLVTRDTMLPKTAYIGLDDNTWWFPFVDEEEIWLCVNAFSATPTSAYIRVGEGERIGFFAGSRAAGNVVSIASPLAGVETVSYAPDSPGSPATGKIPYVFAIWQSGASASHTNAGMCWYSVGSTIDLALLGPRVATLQAALAAAIP
jgi:hypothetical protein